MTQDACTVPEDSDLAPHAQTTPVLHQCELLTLNPCLAAPLYWYGTVTSHTRDFSVQTVTRRVKPAGGALVWQ